MDGLNIELVRALASGGATLVMAAVVLWFIRGDIISRPVYQKQTEDIIARVVAEVTVQYQEMTESIIERVLVNVTAGVISSVQQMLKEWETNHMESNAQLVLEVERLRAEKDELKAQARQR